MISDYSDFYSDQVLSQYTCMYVVIVMAQDV